MNERNYMEIVKLGAVVVTAITLAYVLSIVISRFLIANLMTIEEVSIGKEGS